jgi:Ca2+-binding RTX toxin-like protein
MLNPAQILRDLTTHESVKLSALPQDQHGTGALFYDSDGSGKAAAIQIAVLSKNLKMTPADLLII